MATAAKEIEIEGDGEWMLFDGRSSSENGNQIIIRRGNPIRYVALVYETTPEFGQFTPTARLLLAAPELLAACKAVLAGVDMAAIEQVRAAVAKAEKAVESDKQKGAQA